MKHAVLLLGIVSLLIFTACGNDEKGEQPAQSKYQGAVEGVKEEAHGVTATMEEKAEGAVEALKAKTGEAVETAKETAAKPFQGMAEKLGGHTEAADEALK